MFLPKKNMKNRPQKQPILDSCVGLVKPDGGSRRVLVSHMMNMEWLWTVVYVE